MRRKTVMTAWTIALSLTAASLSAQSLPSSAPGPDFGSFGSSSQDLWVPAMQFVPTQAQDWKQQADGYWAAPTGGDMVAPVALPAGALIESIRCFFYDDDSTLSAIVRLQKREHDIVANTPVLTTLTVGIPSFGPAGYVQFSNLAPIDHTVRYRVGDLQGYYELEASMPATSDVRLMGCRIGWQRQVSVAMRTPTFDDVPSNHPYFKFVEALVDSGITAGCAPDTFCVNNPITRGEMAVFLAAALGLHFPY